MHLVNRNKSSLRPPRSRRSGVLFVSFVSFVVNLTSQILHAQSPQWWTDHGLLLSMPVTNDYAPANIGQLKNYAEQAYYELESKLPFGAGTSVVALVSSIAPVNDYYPVNAGQLKNVAKPFYDRLIEIGYTNSYPWPSSPTNDYAPVNIGQVKYIFSFNLDSDSDNLPDWWEIAHGLDPEDATDAATDPDEDGLTNLQEFLASTDPFDADTDDDGINDGQEALYNKTDPFNPDISSPLIEFSITTRPFTP